MSLTSQKVKILRKDEPNPKVHTLKGIKVGVTNNHSRNFKDNTQTIDEQTNSNETNQINPSKVFNMSRSGETRRTLELEDGAQKINMQVKYP